MNAIELARRLRQEADDILHQRGLEAILRAYGRVSPTGSYALDAMAWPDLDINMVLEPDPHSTRSFFRLGEQVAALGGVISMRFNNCLVRRIEDWPKGLYWGVRLETPRQPIPWKIDIWAHDAYQFADNMALMDRIQAAMTADARRSIIEVKHALLTPEGRTPVLSGYHIYQAVLFEGITDLEGIRNYLRRQGVAEV